MLGFPCLNLLNTVKLTWQESGRPTAFYSESRCEFSPKQLSQTPDLAQNISLHIFICKKRWLPDGYLTMHKSAAIVAEIGFIAEIHTVSAPTYRSRSLYGSPLTELVQVIIGTTVDFTIPAFLRRMLASPNSPKSAAISWEDLNEIAPRRAAMLRDTAMDASTSPEAFARSGMCHYDASAFASLGLGADFALTAETVESYIAAEVRWGSFACIQIVYNSRYTYMYTSLPGLETMETGHDPDCSNLTDKAWRVGAPSSGGVVGRQ